jgi:hypothetical protein
MKALSSSLFFIIIFTTSITFSQVTDTTFTLNGQANCLLVSDTTRVNINSIAVGFETGLQVNSRYQITLSGQAYFSPTVEIPGVYLLYHDKEGAKYKVIAVSDTIEFIADRGFFYAFMVDRMAISDNWGDFYLHLKEIVSTGIQIYSQHSIDDFEVKQNYPNPFNPSTTIEYTVYKPSKVRIEIYNFLGQSVRTLVNEEKNVGNHSVVWDGKDDNSEQVLSGTYFYRIIIVDFVSNKKMLHLR